jgi:hypothetical protein
MTDDDKLKVKVCVVAAIYKVAGMGTPPEDAKAIDEYLKTPIRVVLGINASAEQRKKTAKLIAGNTNVCLRKVFGFPKSLILARYDWLYGHEDEPVSTYADKVIAAVAAQILGRRP